MLGCAKLVAVVNKLHVNSNLTQLIIAADNSNSKLVLSCTKFCYTSCTSLSICNFPNPRHLAQQQCKQVTKEHCTPKANKIVKELTNKIPREECQDSVKRICHQVPVTKPKQQCQNLTTEACQVRR